MFIFLEESIPNTQSQKFDVVCWTDGGSRGNPGPSAIGVVIEDQNNKKKNRFHKFLGNNFTNNFAEYQALIVALKFLKKQYSGKRVLCIADSELMVKQLNGEYQVKNPEIKKLFQEAMQLKKNFGEVVFQHVRRNLNSEADALVNYALDQHSSNI